MTDTNLLWMKMGDAGLSTPKIAKALGISKTSAYNKMVGKAEFNLQEVRGMIELLGLTDKEILRIFFGR